MAFEIIFVEEASNKSWPVSATLPNWKWKKYEKTRIYHKLSHQLNYITQFENCRSGARA
jgi:hypothetical protein